jgi:hypothetical protein
MILARQYILPWAMKIGSPKFRRWVVNSVPWKTLHEVRDIIDTIEEYMVKIYNMKKREFEMGDSEGKDLLSTLCKSRFDFLVI